MFPRNRITAFATALLPIAFGSFAVCGQTMVEADRSPGNSGREKLNPSNIEDALAIVLDSPERPVLHSLALLLSDSATETTELDLSVESRGSNSVVVAPRAEVRYEVIGVLSDDANEGLALFGFNLVFDGGDLSHADLPTAEPTPGCDDPMINFMLPWGVTNPDSPCPPACGYGGTIIDGDLIQVGGAQNTLNNTPDNAPFPIGPVLTGVARPSGCGPAVLVTGTLTAPDVEGTYSLAVTEPFANVIREGETGEPYWAAETAGVGTTASLTITVSGISPALDIKPGSCPNPVNARSRGVVPIAVVGGELFDVTDIDVDSLVLTRANGIGGAVAPIGRRNGRIASLEDVATPFDGGLCGCHAFGGDGFDDLVLKFSTEEMVDTLELDSLGRDTQLTLTISGRLLDGAEFLASDCIVLVGKGRAGEMRSVPATARRRRGSR